MAETAEPTRGRPGSAEAGGAAIGRTVPRNRPVGTAWAALALLSASVVSAQWAVLDSDPRERSPAHLYHAFSQSDWDAYQGAPEASVRQFREMRYGLFIHYGLSSFRGADLSWSRETRAFPDPGQGTIPDDEYEGFAGEFRMERFDADEWVRLAVRAGMRYVVVVAKHHDGFHMWNTAHSDFKVTNSPFGRDYLKELTAACHRAGMPVGVYYSQRDWHHPDYQPLDRAVAEPAPRPPFWRPIGGAGRRAGPRHASYVRYMHATVRELLTDYGRIDFLWWDALWWGGMYHADMWDSASVEREARRLQPHILINNRAGLPGDYDTPEQRLGMFQDGRPWESCISLGPHWAWSPGDAKSKREIVRLLVGTASGDGNLLISTGARADGSFDPEHASRLEEVGGWLDRYGHTIYGTRGGPWKPGRWGGSTRAGNTVYVHVTDWPAEGLVVPALGVPPARVRLATGGGSVALRRDNGQWRFDVAADARDEIDTIIEVELSVAR